MQTSLQPDSLLSENDALSRQWYVCAVRHSRPKRFTNWFLREWMETLRVNQAALIEKTGLSKTAISLLVNDRQDYTPEIIRDIADALNIATYELLMEPDDAMNLRALRNDAIRVVEHAASKRIREQADERKRTGTDG